VPVRKFAILDGSPARTTSNADIVLGGRAMTTNLSNTSAYSQAAAANVGVRRSGVFAYEVLFYGVDINLSQCVLGLGYLSLPEGSVEGAPGFFPRDDAIGFEPDSGEVWYKEDPLDTYASFPAGNTPIGLIVDLDRQEIALVRNNEVVITVSRSVVDPNGTFWDYFDSGEALVPWVSVSGGPAGERFCWINTGQQQFEQQILRNLGWFESREPSFNISVAAQEYRAPFGGELSNRRFRGDVQSSSALSLRKLNFWMWGGSPSSSVLRLTLANDHGKYDAVIGGAFRDEIVTLYALSNGTIEPRETFVFDGATATDDGEVQITFRDRMIELEKPGQRRFFLPNAEGNVANRAYPTTIGAAFSVPLVAYDVQNRLYAIDSIGAPLIGKVRDKGDPLEIFASPPDYEVINGGQAVALRFDPEGAVTADISVLGTDPTGLNGSPPPDVLAGRGNPFNPADDPTFWESGSVSYSGTMDLSFSGEMRFEQVASSGGYGFYRYKGAQLLAGRNYVIRFRLFRLRGTVVAGNSVVTSPGTFGLSSTSSAFNNIITIRAGSEVQQPPFGQSFPWERVYEVYYSPSFTHDLYATFTPGNLQDVGNPGCVITQMTVIEIPFIDPSLSDREVDEDIVPLSLESATRQLIEDRWELSPSFWRADDFAELDLTTGYGGVGWHAQEQYVRRTALEELLTGYTAAAYMDRTSRLRCTRLVAPEEQSGTDVIREFRRGDFLKDIVPVFDSAPRLTTRLGVRKNYRVLAESDLVTDFIDVPLSLRRRLGQEYRFIVNSGVQLAPGYSHAEFANAIGTALGRTQDGQREIDRVCGIYSRARAFYPTSLPYEVSSELELGGIYRVFYPRYGLQNGVLLMLVEVVEDPINQVFESVVFWGLAPSELLGA